MNIIPFLTSMSEYIWSFPFLIAFMGICVFMTAMLKFVQFTHIGAAVRMVFGGSSGDTAQKGGLTSFQAFINTLGANIGNGSLAGVPVAIATGGPGALFWLLVMSTFAVALRYAEVYLGTCFIGKHKFKTAAGGPMLYLSLLPAGTFFSYLFAVLCLGYAFICGNIVQCNSVGLAMSRSWGINPMITACGVLGFIAYILLGGSHRIVKYLDLLVPFKVGVFLFSALIVLGFHWQAIPAAFYLMVAAAFDPTAFAGGVVGFTLQKAIATGFQRGIFVHEAGLGTAAVAFGTTAGKEPAKDSVLSMLSVYINTHVVCLLVGLAVISTGVWNNGETSAALIISAYETVFGWLGGWIITFLVVNFGVSVLVSYAYIARVCWDFITGGRGVWAFMLLYAGLSYIGTVSEVGLVWVLSDLINAGLFVVNIFGILWFVGKIRAGLQELQKA